MPMQFVDQQTPCTLERGEVRSFVGDPWRLLIANSQKSEVRLEALPSLFPV